jgi:2-dehydropantoate 2-reductase
MSPHHPDTEVVDPSSTPAERSTTKYVFIGGGAMGSLFAWHLKTAGAEVWIYDPWKAHVDTIGRNGLRVRHRGETLTVAVRSTCDPNEPGEADVAIVFVKFGQTYAALQAARPIVGCGTILVTLQNGIGNVEILRSLFANRIVYGLTTLTSELLEPGLIEASYEGAGETYLWPDDSRVDEPIRSLVDTLCAGGVNARATPDIDARIWRKLVVNCCLNTMCAATGKIVGELVDQEAAWPVLDGIVDEVVAAAGRVGVRLDGVGTRKYVREVAAAARNHAPSMLIDVRHGRRTEIECLNGAVLDICRRHGVAAPFNQSLYSIIRCIDADR